MNLGTLNETAIQEIRAELARQRMTQAELAQRMEPERSQRYVSHRLTGRVPLSMDDMETISNVLGVPILQLCQPKSPAQSD